MRLGLVLTALATALLGPVQGQEPGSSEPNQRPSLTVPEPRRRTPLEQLPLLVSVTYGEAEPGVDRFVQALPELVRYIHRDTKVGLLLRTLEASLGEPRANGALLLYLTGNRAALRFSHPQRRWLGQYLRDGGLLYAEDVVPLPYGQSYVRGAGQPGTVFDVQVSELLRQPEVLGQDGGDWKRIPDDHPLFSSFFAFAGAPPPGGTDQTEVTYLKMLEWRGRVVVILSELNVSWAWASPHAPGRTRGLQFGTNLVVFALARKSAGPALRGP